MLNKKLNHLYGISLCLFFIFGTLNFISCTAKTPSGGGETDEPKNPNFTVSNSTGEELGSLADFTAGINATPTTNTFELTPSKLVLVIADTDTPTWNYMLYASEYNSNVNVGELFSLPFFYHVVTNPDGSGMLEASNANLIIPAESALSYNLLNAGMSASGSGGRWGCYTANTTATTSYSTTGTNTEFDHLAGGFHEGSYYGSFMQGQILYSYDNVSYVMKGSSDYTITKGLSMVIESELETNTIESMPEGCVSLAAKMSANSNGGGTGGTDNDGYKNYLTAHFTFPLKITNKTTGNTFEVPIDTAWDDADHGVAALKAWLTTEQFVFPEGTLSDLSANHIQ